MSKKDDNDDDDDECVGNDDDTAGIGYLWNFSSCSSSKNMSDAWMTLAFL